MDKGEDMETNAGGVDMRIHLAQRTHQEATTTDGLMNFCELSELMVERIVPDATAAPIGFTGLGNGVELDSTGVEINVPLIRVTSAPISSVMRLIRSRIELKKGMLLVALPVAAESRVAFCPGTRTCSRSRLVRTRLT